jgi:hypothetical protein
MRGASDPSRWPTTLPLYVNKHAFERQLGIPSEKQVTLLLLDRKGRVLSRVTGPPADNSRTGMENALRAAGAAALPAPPPPTSPPPH